MWTVPYSNICSNTALREKANIQLFCQFLFRLHLLNWQDAWIWDSKDQVRSNFKPASPQPSFFQTTQQAGLALKVEGILYAILYTISYTILRRPSKFQEWGLKSDITNLVLIVFSSSIWYLHALRRWALASGWCSPPSGQLSDKVIPFPR